MAAGNSVFVSLNIVSPMNVDAILFNRCLTKFLNLSLHFFGVLLFVVFALSVELAASAPFPSSSALDLKRIA